jgi:NAD(P)-dependent dehydrogenase (short-subunit alcohol dehydrogenase family)
MAGTDHDRSTYLVTGATGGIGEAIAVALARQGGRVLLGARSAQRGNAAAERIRAQVPGADLAVVTADLSDMAQVRALADQVRQETTRLDGLILNAAEARGGLTPQGLAITFATNHLAGFLLTDLLLPLLRDTAPARVVVVSSSAHTRATRLDLATVPTSADYFTTKLLNLLFVAELARRTEGSGVTATAADPGFVRTDLGRHATGAFRLFLTLSRPFQASPAKAARTPVFLATAPELATASGGYYSASRPARPSALAQDPELARQLWDLSTSLLAER